MDLSDLDSRLIHGSLDLFQSAPYSISIGTVVFVYTTAKINDALLLDGMDTLKIAPSPWEIWASSNTVH